MVHRIQNRNPGYSDFSNLGSNTSFNFSTNSPISSGANALKLENEITTESSHETVANENINEINNQYHEELLKNQEAENVIDNTLQDDENSFTKEAINNTIPEENSGHDLKEFGVENLSLIHI